MGQNQNILQRTRGTYFLYRIVADPNVKFAALQRLRDESIQHVASSIQSWYRSRMLRKKFLAIMKAARVLQSGSILDFTSTDSFTEASRMVISRKLLLR